MYNNSMPITYRNEAFFLEVSHFFDVMIDAYNFAQTGRNNIQGFINPFEREKMDSIFSLYDCILYDAKTSLSFFQNPSYNYEFVTTIPPVYYRNIRFNVECFFDIFLFLFDKDYYSEYSDGYKSNGLKDKDCSSISKKGLRTVEIGFDKEIERRLYTCVTESNKYIHTSFIFEPRSKFEDKNSSIKNLMLTTCFIMALATEYVLSYVKGKGITVLNKYFPVCYDGTQLTGWTPVNINSFDSLNKYKELEENTRSLNALCQGSQNLSYYF